MNLFGKGGMGGMGDMMSLMKNAGKIKETIKRVQEDSDLISVTGQSFNGKIQITMLGSGTITKTTISKEAISELEHDLLEDYISAAINDGNRLIKEKKKQLLSEATAELGISPELLQEFA